MKLIVGLGNPGREYESSRHNVGFCLVDLLSRRWSIDVKRRRHRGRYGGGLFDNERVVLLKPQTFMNRSGGSVGRAVDFYKVPLSDLLVVVDDMALELGRLRLRSKGSAGGHNGLKDIINRLGSEEFARLRIGIGAPRYDDAVKYVLGEFCGEELEEMEKALKKAANCVECWINEGIDKTMTRYNLVAE